MSLTLFVATHVIILASDHSTASLTGRLHSQPFASVQSFRWSDHELIFIWPIASLLEAESDLSTSRRSDDRAKRKCACVHSKD